MLTVSSKMPKLVDYEKEKQLNASPEVLPWLPIYSCFVMRGDLMISLSDDKQANIIDAFKSKKDRKDQESIQPSVTPVPGYQMGK